MDRTTYYRLLQQALNCMQYLSHQLSEDSLFSGLEEQDLTGPVVGIDLGTTNSCCAVVSDGKPSVIPSRMGYTTLPSVIAIDQSETIEVGHGAAAKMEIQPQRTVYGSKRLVGRPFDSPVVKEVRSRFLYNIIKGVNGLCAVEIGDRKLALEEVSGLILSELRQMAENYLGQTVNRAVVTVPAYYNENQRLSVRKAGAHAGLKIERILNEPTAAALAYGHLRGKDQRVLIYDLGGGTFDVSVMNLNGTRCEVLSTGGDTFLGGVDFDSLLMDHLLSEYKRKHAKKAELDRFSTFRVLNAAEAAKKNLSEVKSTVARFNFWDSKKKKSVEFAATISRQKLDELVLPLVTKTLSVCDDVLRKARTEPDELDEILLVGGQTRMPLIWRKITDHLKKNPHKGVHPDEAVALGAAILADAINRSGVVNLLDVLPMAVGTGLPGGKFKTLLPAGNSVNVSRTFSITTFFDNQTTLLFPVYQGESNSVSDNELLGVFSISGIPPGPAGSRQLELTFSLTPECLLVVSAADREAGALGQITLLAHETPSAMPPDETEDLQEPEHLEAPTQPDPEEEEGFLKRFFKK